jgi:hypothetical protein
MNQKLSLSIFVIKYRPYCDAGDWKIRELSLLSRQTLVFGEPEANQLFFSFLDTRPSVNNHMCRKSLSASFLIWRSLILLKSIIADFLTSQKHRVFFKSSKSRSQEDISENWRRRMKVYSKRSLFFWYIHPSSFISLEKYDQSELLDPRDSHPDLLFQLLHCLVHGRSHFLMQVTKKEKATRCEIWWVGQVIQSAEVAFCHYLCNRSRGANRGNVEMCTPASCVRFPLGIIYN